VIQDPVPNVDGGLDDRCLVEMKIGDYLRCRSTDKVVLTVRTLLPVFAQI
jgi:hypothetical protein